MGRNSQLLDQFYEKASTASVFGLQNFELNLSVLVFSSVAELSIVILFLAPIRDRP